MSTNTHLEESRAQSIQHTSNIRYQVFELQVRVSMVCSSWVNAVFIRNDFPELGTNLISALAALDVHELAHGSQKVASESERHGLL